MSGLLISLQPIDPERVPQIADSLSFVDGEWHTVSQEDAWTLVQARSDREDLWGPAKDPDTGVAVHLAGRVAMDEEGWREAETLPYSGGLACRAILHAFRSNRETFAGTLNGAFSVVITEPARRRVHVVTDRMGFIPLYAYQSGGRAVVATHPDVLAANTGRQHNLDVLSMAEMVATGAATHPHTYYEDIDVLDPGCVYTWGRDGTATRVAYWTPQYRGGDVTRVKALGEELEHALRGAITRRTLPRLGSSGVLLSGGADSRAVLYAACQPSEVTSITFYDTPNAEFDTARRLAERVGSEHIGLQREFEHYGLGAPKAVRVAGGMWNVLDAHYTEFLSQIRTLGLDNLLTGCYADYLFKGLTSNRSYKTLFGKNLPLYDFAPFGSHWYAPHGPVGARWKKQVAERQHAMYEGLDLTDGSDTNRWAIELRRIRPVAREADTAGRLLLQRTLPWDSLFADTALIDLYERIPPSMKLNGQVWENAVGRICRVGGDITNNNSLSPIGASQTEKTLRFLHGVAYRKLFGRDVDGTSLDGSASRGSWPDFNHYIRHSTVWPKLWADPSPTTRDVLNSVAGEDLWTQPMSHWARRGSLLFARLVTLKLWLDQRDM